VLLQLFRRQKKYFLYQRALYNFGNEYLLTISSKAAFSACKDDKLLGIMERVIQTKAAK
jgi:hypothetical protein